MRRLAPALALFAAVALADHERWPEALPAFSLQDVTGVAHTQADFLAHGGVIIVTAPRLSQSDRQVSWDDAVAALPVLPAGPRFAMVEDMSQSVLRGLVISTMKERYDPKRDPWLLLDEQGAVRKAFGLAEDMTVAFAFAPGGRRLAVETGPGSKERAAQLLKLVTDAAK